MYSKKKDEIMSGLEEKLSKITEKFVGVGGVVGSQHAKCLLK